MVDVKTLLSRIDEKDLHPKFVEKLKELLINCGKRGAVYYAISGYRSWDEQAAIYAKGRDEDGKVVKKEEVVSNAPPGTSFHNYRIACDFARDKDLKKIGLQPSWDHKDYKILGEEAEKLGLEAGVFWKNFVDAPHIQIRLKTLGLTSIHQLKSIRQKRGDEGILEFLDSKLE